MCVRVCGLPAIAVSSAGAFPRDLDPLRISVYFHMGDNSLN